MILVDTNILLRSAQPTHMHYLDRFRLDVSSGKGIYTAMRDAHAHGRGWLGARSSGILGS